MKRKAFFVITVLAASASVLAGGLLPSPEFESEEALTFNNELEIEENYISPLRSERRSLLPDYPPGIEPGLLALMRVDGFGNSAFSFATASALEARRVLYADIASLNPGFGGETETGLLREPRVLEAYLGDEWGRERVFIPIQTAIHARHDGFREAGALERSWIARPRQDRPIQLSAQQADAIHFGHLGRDTTNSVAQLAWTSEIAGAGGPRITGGVFLGSETPKERDLGIGWSGRKYYGLSLESRFTAFQKHTPFASLQIARSDYEGGDAGGATVFNPGVTAGYGYPGSSSALSAAGRRDDYSRLGAGWNWQIQPNWGLRAEAYYSLNGSGASAYEYDRSQFFFSSRYDFR